MTGGRLTYSVEEVAEVLGVGRTTVYEVIRTGQLATLKIGQRRLIAKVDLEAFIDDRRRAA